MSGVPRPRATSAGRAVNPKGYHAGPPTTRRYSYHRRGVRRTFAQRDPDRPRAIRAA
jgi:hypothetical protein